MNPSSSLGIKLLSLAVVLWAVLSGSSLASQGAAWVPWMALSLLMLLEAYAADSQPAAWSQWSAGLARLLSPGMLPYYAVLSACLAIGPGQLRHDLRTLPPHGGPSATLATAPPAGGAFPRPFPTSPQVRPPAFSGSKTQRPAVNAPAAFGSNRPVPAGKSAPFQRPTAVPANGTNGGAARVPAQLGTSQSGAVRPPSSTKPPATPAK